MAKVADLLKNSPLGKYRFPLFTSWFYYLLYYKLAYEFLKKKGLMKEWNEWMEGEGRQLVKTFFKEGLQMIKEDERKKKAEVCHLVVKPKWYHLIKEGIKKTEYRDNTEFWRKRIRGRKFVTFHRGYTKETMTFNIAMIHEDDEQILIHLGERIDEM